MLLSGIGAIYIALIFTEILEEQLKLKAMHCIVIIAMITGYASCTISFRKPEPE